MRGLVFRAKKLVDEDDLQDDVDAVLALQKEARAAGAFTFLTRFPGDLDSYLAVVPEKDPFTALAVVEAGGEDVDVEKALRSLNRSAGLTMTRVQFDTVSGRLARAPKDLGKHARAISNLALEGELDEVKSMLKRKELFLWWD